MARAFCSLDPNALGPGMELEQGGLVVTTNIETSDIHRMARGTIACVSGQMFFEAVFYGEDALLDHACVGIVQSTHSLAKYVGEQATGYGFKVGNGDVYNNNAALSTGLLAADKKVYIGVLVDKGDNTVTFYINGSPNATVSITADKLWYPAVTVSGTAYNNRCYINFGQYKFAFPPSGAIGWYKDTPAPGALYFCPRECGGFCTAKDDAIPSTTFKPRILNASDWSFTRQATVWPWDARNGGGSYSELTIDNHDGIYDSLLSQDRRDQIFQCVATTANDTYDHGTVIATGVIDSIDAVDERTIKVTIRDRMTTLERPLQQRLFPPFFDVGVAWRPWPITLGACRNIEPILYDSENRKYAIHDAPITNIAAVRDKGARLDPYDSPPQYTPTNDLQGIQLETNPVGLLTSDVSSEGSQVLIPGAVDIFGGAGDFSTWPTTPGAPTNWTANIGGTGSISRTGSVTPYIAQLTTTHAYQPSPGVPAEMCSHLSYNSVLLQPGKTYRVQFELVRSSGATSPVVNGQSYGMMVRSDLTDRADGAISPHMQPLQAPTFGTVGQKYTFTYTCPVGAARKVYFLCTAAKTSNGTGAGFALIWFNQIKIELLGEAAQILPLTGITLTDYMTEVFESRGGLSASDWVSADCDNIDAATGYRFGVHIDESTTVLATAKAPLDSFCATQIGDELGRIRTRRLVNPMDVNDSEIVAEFDMTNVQYGVIPRPDLARGLTTRIGVRRNWKQFSDADFVTDETEVSPATKRQFKNEFQLIQTTAKSPSPTYRFAGNAPPLESVLDDPIQGQAEIDRVFAPYAANRVRFKNPTPTRTGIKLGMPRFFEFSAIYRETAPPLLLFGDIIRLTYDRYNLDLGQKLMVVSVTFIPFSKRLKIIAWGSE